MRSASISPYGARNCRSCSKRREERCSEKPVLQIMGSSATALDRNRRTIPSRSEEHTSELQSLMRTSYAVFCLQQQQSTPTGLSQRCTGSVHLPHVPIRI